jgi:predicted amidophosphoribosyltransferase
VAFSLTDLLVPPACIACRAHGSWPLCGACRRTLPFLLEPCCPRCALPQPCGRRCPAADAAFQASWAPLAHEGAARALVIALKYRGGRSLASALAAPMIAAAPAGTFDRGLVLVPVPSDPARARERGYNQAAVIAAVLGERLGLPLADALRQLGPSHSQVGAGAVQRRAEASLLRARLQAPARCLLVDDVHTTGATLHACARALRAAGAQVVTAVTATRTL